MFREVSFSKKKYFLAVIAVIPRGSQKSHCLPCLSQNLLHRNIISGTASIVLILYGSMHLILENMSDTKMNMKMSTGALNVQFEKVFAQSMFVSILKNVILNY